MRVLFLSHYFPPELGAAAPRAYETARRLAASGHLVTVLTGFPHYPTGVIPSEYRGRREVREQMNGVEVIRSWVWATPNVTATRRVLNQLSLATTSLWGGRLAKDIDVMVVETPPLLLSTSGYVLSRWKSAPFVLRVGDLWPSSAVRLGVLTNRALIRTAEVAERFVYQRAARIVAVTAGIRDQLLERGYPEDKVCHISNGVDTSVFRAGVESDFLRERFGVQGKFVVLYAGNIGLAQGLGSVLEAAALLRSDPDVRIVLVGEGVERRRLEEQVQREGMDNVSFLGAQPRELMPAVQNMADVALVSLVADPFFEMAVPSKLLEAMACERPVVLAASGESADILSEAGAGVTVPPEDPQSLAGAILQLQADAALRKEMGRQGRQYVRQRYDWNAIAQRFERLLVDVVQKRRNTPVEAG